MGANEGLSERFEEHRIRLHAVAPWSAETAKQPHACRGCH